MAKPTIKDTKEAILKAYNELFKENQQLKSQVSELEEQLETDEDYDGDSYDGVEAGSFETVGDIISNLTSVQQSIAQSLSNLSAEQVVEAAQLQKIASQISEEKNQVKTLYGIDINENTFEETAQSYEEQKTSFEDNFADKKKMYGEDLSGKNIAWSKEQDDYNRKIADRNKETQTSRKREQDEFDYTLKQTRAAQDDVHNQKRKATNEELIELKATKEKTWAEQEKSVADREHEFSEYKRKYEAADADLQKEIKKAEAEARAIVERDHKVKLALYNADVDADQKTLELRINTQKEQIKNQDEQIKKLSVQLDKALTQAQSLALKALEGTANAESFSAIREIAVEQAKSSNKSK
jgi:hypothetical protein